MTEQEALALMVAPGTPRQGKYRSGVVQINVTSACNMACFNCTQGSNLAGEKHVMTPEQFRQAVMSLGFREGGADLPPAAIGSTTGPYYGVVGVFGGNPALSPHFDAYCQILKEYVPFEQRGLWCNHPRGKGRMMQGVFDPSVSNLNVHLDQEAYDQFKRDWPDSRPFGLYEDSRHSPPFVAMKDVITKEDHNDADGAGKYPDEDRIWGLISNCDINQHWSAMIGVFRDQIRAWFCEIAGAQAMLHQAEPDYPDTGLDPTHWHDFRGYHSDSYVRQFEKMEMTDPGEAVINCDFPWVPWWTLGMNVFKYQVRKHCFDCGVPLRGYGELAQADTDPAAKPVEQVSATHAGVYRPKRSGRRVEVVTELVQLGTGKIQEMTRYLQNAKV